MTEELGLDQLLRDGGAVDLDEGPARDPRRAVELARDELLARAAFAEDEDRGRRRRRARDLGPQPAHGLAVAHEFGLLLHAALQLEILHAQAIAREGVAERDENSFPLERLFEEVGGASPRTVDRRCDVAVARDHEDRRRCFARDDAVQDFRPLHAVHLDIQDHSVEAVGLELSESLRPTG